MSLVIPDAVFVSDKEFRKHFEIELGGRFKLQHFRRSGSDYFLAYTERASVFVPLEEQESAKTQFLKHYCRKHCGQHAPVLLPYNLPFTDAA